MTNEEKAHRICETITSVYGVDIAQEARIYSAVKEAMQWKDEQLKIYLKEKWASLAGNCCSIDSVRRSVVASIYEDLFNEKLTTNPYETAR